MDRTSHLERESFGRLGRRWWVVYPAVPDEGMGLEAGPFITRFGALFHRWLWK
jgi:hypothetical protein